MTIGGKCGLCKNAIVDGIDLPVKNGKNICLAFPEGIPDEIVNGYMEHDHIIEGQTGDYIFERMTEEQ